VVDAAGGARRERRDTGLLRAFGAIAVVLIGVYPVLPELWRGIVQLALAIGAAGCVTFGRRRVERRQRRPWTLLVCALVLFVGVNVLMLFPEGHDASLLVDAVGNGLVLAAALSVVVRRGVSDLGGIIDAAVIAFAAGSVLWGVLPHRVSTDTGFPAQVDLFVVVFALTGVLGALMRLVRDADGHVPALIWLLVSIALAIAGNVLGAVGGTPPAATISQMLFMGAFTAVGLFGLDPAGPGLASAQQASQPERLSPARLAFLGVALAVIPGVIGIRELMHGRTSGLLLLVQGVLISALVMVRIGLLATQRAQAERALAHEATHDPLTHLANRREFVDRLRAEVALGTPCVLLFCDLDDFKGINDRYGHDAGDRLLVEVARRLDGCVGRRHVVSRFGGDEFVILLVGASMADAEVIRSCVVTELTRAYDQVDGATVGVSIGVMSAESGRDPDQLIRSADHAMYREKAARRSQVRWRTDDVD
jgi:diguanylate cyclase (GGDEF)-like protein